MIRRFVGVLGLAAVGALTGCAGASCPVPSLRFADGRVALDHHARLRAWARTLRAEASVDRRGQDSRVRGTVLMMAERPDHVRFDAMTQFGPAAVLTSDGASFSLTDLRENRFYSGPPCAENIALLLGIPMEAEDIGRVLFGEAPTIEADATEVVCEGASYRVTLRSADGREEIQYALRPGDELLPPEEQHLRVREASLFGASGQLAWRIRWDDYRVVLDPSDDATPRRGVAMPFRVQVEIPAQSVDTLIRFESIELNPTLRPDSFHQDVRPGLAVEPVECGE